MPGRPPKKWFKKVVKRLTFHPRVADPVAVAGWMWSNWLTPEKKSQILAAENPRIYASQLEKAVKLFGEFQGKQPTRGTRVNVPDPPSTVVYLGELVQVNYRTSKGDSGTVEFYHRFKRPRPKLVTDPAGKKLFLVGGRFKITDKGIEG